MSQQRDMDHILYSLFWDRGFFQMSKLPIIKCQNSASDLQVNF